MNAVIALLLAFIGLGLASVRIGRATYMWMGLAILLYVGYAYISS